MASEKKAEAIEKGFSTPLENLSKVNTSGLSSGSTLLNLACSSDPNWAYPKGSFIYFVGDSSSGKTFHSFTCLAEAVKNPEFKDYKIIFDNAENGALMNISQFFGKELEKRLLPPSGNWDDPRNSSTVEEFYYNVDDAFDTGKPIIYLLDSMDSLTTEDEEEQFDKEKKASRAGKDTTGSFGTAKAKKNSSNIRVVTNKLRETGSILLMISQTRQNIGFGSQFRPKTRSGGTSLKFYSHLELWTSVREVIKTSSKIRGKEWEQGVQSRIKVEKNRLTGRLSTIDIPIYWSTGIDETGSMVNWLVEMNHWKEKAGKIHAKEILSAEMEVEDLIRYIEETSLLGDLRDLVCKIWNEIQEECSVKRVSRYD